MRTRPLGHRRVRTLLTALTCAAALALPVGPAATAAPGPLDVGVAAGPGEGAAVKEHRRAPSRRGAPPVGPWASRPVVFKEVSGREANT